MNKNLLILIFLISLFSISVSFAVSEDFDSVNTVDVDKDKLDASGLVEGKDYIINENGNVTLIGEDVNPGDYQWSYGDDSKTKDSSNNTKPLKASFPVGQLSEDYKNGFEGFVLKLEDMRYYMCSAYDENGVKHSETNILYDRGDSYNSSINLTTYDALNFEYKGEKYNIYKNNDFINLNASQAIPVYIVGDSVYVGNPADNTTPDFKGYAVKDTGIRWYLGHTGDSISTNNQSNTSVEKIGTANNISKSVNNENVSIISNDTANADGDNIPNILASAAATNSLEKTGLPIAILVLAILSVFVLRRKD